MIDHTNQISINESSNQFNLSLEGYEGPIDLLLDLAKKQKVNLSNISILKLAEQYIDFIQEFKELHLEIAADYLVMASWLTYLKSRLLLPKEIEAEEYTSEELEAALKYQLQRLGAMQNISKILYSRPLIGRDKYYRGFSEDIRVKYDSTVRNTANTVVQFKYGEDSIDPTRSKFGDAVDLDAIVENVISGGK